MSADRFKIKRGSTSAVNAYTPAQGEPVMDVTLNQLRIGDGTTLGGILVGTLTTTFMASVLNDVDAPTARTTLGAQTQSANLDTLSALPSVSNLSTLANLSSVLNLTYLNTVTPVANGVPYGLTTTTWGSFAITSQGRTLVGTSSQATARTTIAAAGSGANSDITSLTALTTALSVAQGGTGATTVVAARTSLGLSKFASTAAAYTNGTGYTYAHGLGSIPETVQAFAVCVTAEGSWAAGQQISLNTGIVPSAAPGAVYGVTLASDATTLYAKIATGGLAAINFSTGAIFVLTPANWQFIAKARL